MNQMIDQTAGLSKAHQVRLKEEGRTRTKIITILMLMRSGEESNAPTTAFLYAPLPPQAKVPLTASQPGRRKDGLRSTVVVLLSGRAKKSQGRCQYV